MECKRYAKPRHGRGHRGVGGEQERSSGRATREEESVRLGCAAYSYRDYLKDGRMTLDQFVSDCQQMGLDGVELTSYYFPSTDHAYLIELKKHCFSRGMHI